MPAEAALNMTANPLTNSIQLLQSFGFFQVILPMLLVFAIFYAVLIKTQVLGDPSESHVKGLCALVSFVAAFMVISYTPVIVLLQPLLAQASLLLVIVMLVLMILAFTGVFKAEDWAGKPQWWMWIVVIFFLIIFLGILDASGLYIPGIHEIVLAFAGESAAGAVEVTNETWNWIIALALFIVLPIIVIALVVKSTK